MNEHERLGDPAFDRLVAADPAKRAPDPVEGVLRAKVDALIAGSGSRPPAEVRAPSEQAGPDGREPARPGHEPAGPGRTDELAVRRHRRRAPWLVAAAVAGIVAAGGGGYVAGESGLGAGSMAAVEDTGGAESADNAEPSTMGLPEKADAEAAGPLEAGGDLPAGAGLVFHAGAGLSDTPRTAEVRSAGAGGSESLGSYPVVSEVEAVERLGDPRFAGSVLGSRPAPQEDEQARPTAEAPVPGGPIAWPVEDVTIVSASLTEVRYTLADDTELFVPAYDLVDDKGNSWTVVAVDEELLDFAP
jgi:hypothetical protein